MDVNLIRFGSCHDSAVTTDIFFGSREWIRWITKMEVVIYIIIFTIYIYIHGC
jgi:hypothetical protein